MTHLTIYPDTDPGTVLLDTCEGAQIAAALSEIGVAFERWDAPHALGEDADQDTVLKAYERDIVRIMEEGGYQSVDVVRVKPDNPNREELRQKFFAEHTHDDDEVRFFDAFGRGYTMLSLSKDAVDAEFVKVSDVYTPEYTVKTVKSMRSTAQENSMSKLTSL